MSEVIRVGYIGTGGIARRQARDLAAMEDVEIVAGCDISKEALRRFAEEYEVAQTFEDYNDLLQLEDLDAVSVCTPNFMHKEPTIAALKAGKHVLVEKPMAMNAEEAQAMVDAAEASEATLVMGFQRRLEPAPQTLKRFIDDGRIGNVLFARVQALRRLGIPNWGVFGQKELQGGGPLIDIGVHLIEVAHFLMGEPAPVTASAQMFTYAGDRPSDVHCPWAGWDHETYNVEDLAVGFVRFENGATMAVESSFVAHIERDTYNVQIMGDAGGCTVHPPRVFRNESGTMVNIEPAYTGKWQGMTRKLQEWIAFLRGEQETQCPARSGLMVQKILDGLYESAEAGREVELA